MQKAPLRYDRGQASLRMTEKSMALMPESIRPIEEYYDILLRNFRDEELGGSVGVMEKMIVSGEGAEAHLSEAKLSREPEDSVAAE